MPTHQPNLTRSPLTLDQQSFQELLSAAFTIQEHNDRKERAREAEVEQSLVDQPSIDQSSVDQPSVEQSSVEAEPEATTICNQCGALKPVAESHCASCNDELRPGERLQRNWASMWLMSQEQGLWPERLENTREVEQREAAAKDTPVRRSQPLSRPAPKSANSGFLESSAATKTRKTLPTLDHGTTARITEAMHEAMTDAASLDDHLPDGYATKSKWAAGEGVVRQDATTHDLIGEDPTEDYELLEGSELALQASHLPATGFSTHRASFAAEAGIDTYSEAASDVTFDDSPDAASGDEVSDLAVNVSEAQPKSLLQRAADLRVVLHFHRADVYLGAAICVAVLALLWPAPTSSRRSTLGVWDRTLIALGIAEAPAPATHLLGDPAVEVWIDPHSAVYYCPGEDQYGKTVDGRFASQREAQIDHFEPAARSACE